MFAVRDAFFDVSEFGLRPRTASLGGPATSYVRHSHISLRQSSHAELSKLVDDLKRNPPDHPTIAELSVE